MSHDDPERFPSRVSWILPSSRVNCRSARVYGLRRKFSIVCKVRPCISGSGRIRRIRVCSEPTQRRRRDGRMYSGSLRQNGLIAPYAHAMLECALRCLALACWTAEQLSCPTTARQFAGAWDAPYTAGQNGQMANLQSVAKASGAKCCRRSRRRRDSVRPQHPRASGGPLAASTVTTTADWA